MDKNLWMIPIPPSRAIVIAISLSVTTSMFAETIGTCNAIVLVSQLRVESVRRESTSEYCGTSKTSSYVKAVSGKIFMAAPHDLGHPNYNA
jgi:hypothetical protein